MTLKDDMAWDVANVFLDEEDFADGVPAGVKYQLADGGAPFPLKVLMGDAAPSHVAISFGTENRRTARALVDLAVVTAGINAASGGLRNVALREDKLVFTKGAYKGEWKITDVTADNGGGLNLDLVLATLEQAAADGVQDVSG